jgi:hypothetical protein
LGIGEAGKVEVIELAGIKAVFEGVAVAERGTAALFGRSLGSGHREASRKIENVF